MEYRVTRRGAAVIGVHLISVGLLLLFIVRNLFRFTIIAAVFWLLFCLIGLIPHLSSCKLHIYENHLTVRTGILFVTTKRIPLRFVTGCHIVQTPLQHANATCSLFLLTSGSVTVILGMRRKDADILTTTLSSGGQLL